jgi:hypothetical protein
MQDETGMETGEITLGSEKQRRRHSLKAKRQRRQSPEAYERFNGSMPKTNIVAAEVMKEVDPIEEEVTSGQKSVATKVETRRKRRSLGVYKRSYGSIPKTNIVAVEIMKEVEPIEEEVTSGQESAQSLEDYEKPCESMTFHRHTDILTAEICSPTPTPQILNDDSDEDFLEIFAEDDDFGLG